MKPIFSVLLVIVITSLYGCKQNTKEKKIEIAISDLINRFPQLPKGKLKQSDYYKLIRSVTNGEIGFEIQLRSSPDSLKDPQKIIIIGNSNGNYCAIPFLSNTYRDYWAFKFDSLVPNITRTNTTFEREFNNAMESLNLIDSLDTSFLVHSELFISLLQCEVLRDCDSTDLRNYYKWYLNNDIPAENDETYKKRIQQIYQAVVREWHPYSKGFSQYNSVIDNTNQRIYQTDFTKVHSRKRYKISMKIYRIDKVNHYLNL